MLEAYEEGRSSIKEDVFRIYWESIVYLLRRPVNELSERIV